MIKLFIKIIYILLFTYQIGYVNAEIGDIGHWKDSTGGQIPGTTFGGFNFDNEVRNDGIYTKPDDSTIQVSEAGDYLIISTTHDEDTSNGRYNPQLTISQIAGTGDIFSTHNTGFSRNNAENESWTRGVGIIIGASANSQFQVQKRRDTDAPIGGSVVNSSDLQIVKLNQTNYGIYDIGGTGNTYGGTTPNTVDITNILNQSNTASIEGNTTSDTITIKGDNKTYLIAWSVSFNTGGARTQRIGHLEYDNVDSLSTRSYCYGRNAANEYCGLGSMDIIRTSTADIDLQTEIYRGNGVLADEGGADNDGSLVTDGNGQIVILEMPDSLEVFSSQDSVGLQDVTTTQTLNIARDIEINDSSSFTKASDMSVNVVNPSNIFSWANIWTARSNISSGTRLTSYGSIVIDGVEQTTGRHGNYSRGNQATTDTFAMGFNPAGIFTTSGIGTTLGVNSNPLSGGGSGGGDRTQPGTVSFFAINLDTLISPVTNPILGVTYSDNDVDNIVNTNQVLKYSIDIENTGTDATGIAAQIPIDNNFGPPYGFTYLNCGTPSEIFTSSDLKFSNISIVGGNTCNIEYYIQVDSVASDTSIITSNLNVSAAIEGGNNPSIVNSDNLTVLACGITNDVNIEFVTDNWGYETFWSLTPTGNTCGVGEIASGGNTTQVNCTSGGSRSASNGNGYANNSTINEGPFSLNVGTQYDLHVVDDYGDGMTGAPDVVIQQNGSTSDTFVVGNNGGIFTFTVQNVPACSDTINPEVTVNQANSQSDPTLIDSITYNVIFNEPISKSTFIASDISIVGTTGTVTSGPVEVFPFNGTSFDIVVSGMTQGDNVTAIIGAGVVEDLLGNTNNASTSIDNQVTYNGVPASPGGISNNLQIWLKADKGPNNTTDGGNVTNWTDQSQNSFDATSGVAPIYKNNTTDELNFNPVVDFNGTTQYLQNLNNGAYTQSYFLVIVPDNTVDGTATGQVPYGFNCNSGVLNTGTCGLDFAGVTLGAFTAAFNDEVITQAIGSSTSWRAAQLGLASYEGGQPMLIGINENATADGTDIYEKGESLNNFEANTYQSVSTADYALGRSLDNTYPFYYDGKIAEVINYSDRISDIDREKIESYLSLKYGITLQNGTQDYIATDGTLIWSQALAGSYINDIFGIGFDSVTELGQVKSKSSNNDSILTVEAIGEGTNLINSFTDISDKEFLTIANDGLGNTWSSVGAPSGYYNLSRTWRIQEKGEVGTVNLDFDVANTNFDIPNLSIGTDYYFIYDNDNDNDLSDETPSVMTNVSGDIWRVSGVDLDHLREFTISTQASTNNIPTDIFLSNTVVNENISANSVVGTLSTTDADGSDIHTYSLVAGIGDDDNIKVSLTGNTIRLIYSPDFEIKPSYNIRIQTDDGNGGQFQKALTITVNDIGEVVSSIVDFEIDDKFSITSGNWIRDGTDVNQGSNSLRSDIAGIASTQACFIVQHTFAAEGTIEFDYRVESQTGGDFLRFYIDNIEQDIWSGTINWSQYSKNDVTAGFHEYKWCYIKDGTTNTGNDHAIIDYITFQSNSADITNPTISGTNFSNNDLLPGGNHNIIFTYFDSESGINTSGDTMTVNKWNGSSWGGDISASTLNLGSKTVTATQATYPTDNLDYGRYRFNFSIDDNDGNTGNSTIELYFDRPTININTSELDLGNLSDGNLEFSNDEIIITVNTVGAGFNVNMSQDSNFTYGGNVIVNWDGSEGIGYDKTTYTLSNSNINSNPSLYSQSASLNTNGDYNIYEYRVKIGTLIGEQQAAGNYETQLSFYLYLNY